MPHAEPGPPRTIAAVDIGSNSIKMTVARGDAAHLDEFDWRSETVRLGAGIDVTGRLAEDRIEAALETLERFVLIARAHGAARVIAVATEATRIAENGPAFLERAQAETGIEIRTITGDREAELTFLGLDGVVDLDGDVAIADIGGGSTELILAAQHQVAWSQSLPLGSGRMTDKHVPHDPPVRHELQAVERDAGRLVADTPFVPGSRLLVVGGTGEYLHRMLPPNTEATIEQLETLLDRLTRRTAEQVAAALGIAVSRARVLPAGIAIAAAIAKQIRPSRIEMAQSGIRRGLLLAAFRGEL
jgi:exopolyphosphatase/guanosine-5'-triphosphate,3'-diphosphate pyrophosphatase